MFTIHRRNLSDFNNIKIILLRKISILLRKMNVILVAKINKPCNIFDDIYQHIQNKKIINKISILNHIYKELSNIHKNLNHKAYDEKSVKLLIVKLIRK